MKAKPRISKADDGWQVELPAFGFHQATVKGGFGSHKAALGWLTGNGNLGTSSSQAERTRTPEDSDYRWGARWPMVIR